MKGNEETTPSGGHMLRRRRIMTAPVLAVMMLGAAPLLSGNARAAAYPDRVLRMLIPFPPGGTGDVVARALCDQLSTALGRAVVPDYLPGAGGALAATRGAAAPADGYTLLLASTGAFAMGPWITSVPYDPVKSFSPIGQIAASQYVLVVTSTSPFGSVAAVVAQAKAKPGSLTFGSPGVGSVGHLAGELFKKMEKIDIVHVPYRGQAPMDIDLLGGRISMAFAGMGGTVQTVKAGRLKALATTGAHRSPALPDVPTMAQAGVAGYAAEVFWGVVAPAGTPPPVISTVNAALSRAVSQAALRSIWIPQGQEIVTGSPDAFGSLIASEFAKWKTIVQSAGITQQ
jgi:tripartite-type tricarboxylate transporter receptor subunit TctC